ncbi:Qat anti-phage system QueC-like protein QatC [Cetobacterium sp. SF1]|uniref:Qat anti-phage system QueC-like protein QatC n=1 Tax=Cetobacterium sp. SF1 TaxID=3417654 RepID=UPI003CF71DC0
MINIICKINDEDDKFELREKHEILYAQKEKENNKNIFHTFFEVIKKKSLPNFCSYEALDLYYISIFVFSADRIIKRKNFNDGWTRKIKLYIPILEIEKFKINKDLIEKMLTFLSGDIWELEFRKRELNVYEKKIEKTIKKNKKDLNIDIISMFSGGLDSYIGAIDLLEQQKKVIFVSHSGGGKGVKEYQDVLIEQITNNYSISTDNFFQFHARATKGKEDTTRTRSFMFFAHAIAVASTFNKKIELYIPENGLISLNIPITSARNGSSSTRTTHPYYLKLLQTLLNKLDLPILLINPYQFKTKGEMIKECKNINFLKDNLHNTMSCSHPDNGRYRSEKKTCHCGTCIPCVIRRASIKYSGLKDTSIYYDPKFKKGKQAKSNFTAYILGITAYQQSKTNFFKIQKSGPLKNNLKEYCNLYERGMEEFITLIKEFL